MCWIEPNNFNFMIFTKKNVLLLHYGLVTPILRCQAI